MMHGYHMGFGFYGSYIFIFILLIILVVMIFKRAPSANPFIIKLIDLLKEKYASGEISADEFVERKSIIENTEYTSQYVPILLERYARCLITTKDFLSIKNEIESNKHNDLICKQLAEETVSYDEFKSKIMEDK